MRKNNNYLKKFNNISLINLKKSCVPKLHFFGSEFFFRLKMNIFLKCLFKIKLITWQLNMNG